MWEGQFTDTIRHRLAGGCTVCMNSEGACTLGIELKKRSLGTPTPQLKLRQRRHADPFRLAIDMILNEGFIDRLIPDFDMKSNARSSEMVALAHA